MLITCSGCHVQYNREFLSCPICHEVYRPTTEELLAQARETLELQMIKATQSEAELRNWLVEEVKLRDLEADEWISEARRNIKRRSRGTGVRILATGILLLTISPVVFLLVALRFGPTAGGIALILLSILGLIYLIAGVVALVTGWDFRFLALT